VTYYDDALKGLEAQKEELAKAEHFIFMEYHAIEDAESWHEIRDILAERAGAGVEVRIFYDDMGSVGFITTDFVKRTKALGIQCRVFNPFTPGLNLFLNNRDHRKITVIDGKVGFTGGYNLANEYFHRTEPYGFWKDTGIRLEGDAVRSLTITFLEMWNAISNKDKDDKDYSKYLPSVSFPKAHGFVQPYADSPMDDIPVGEDVYMSLAENAQDYVWYITPYLIITDEMNHVLSLAAKRGVDVRIITPGIPDKKIVYSLTRSYYNGLARNGVRIFEFTPGFCHAKMCISDDIVAVCGTINLDYRSLYHHFENGCLYADCQAVMDTKRDFEETFALCNEVTEYYVSGRGALMRFKHMLLRLAAPLM
jgi:cardiolipin synthase